MPQTLTGAAGSLAGSLTAPSDGDVGNVASINGALQTLINNDTQLAAIMLPLAGGTMTGALTNNAGITAGAASGGFTAAGTTHYNLASRAVLRAMNGVPTPYVPANWQYTGAGILSSAVAVPGQLVIPMQIPNGAVLGSVLAYLKGSPSLVSLPTLPTLQIWSMDFSTGNATQLGSTGNDAGPLGSYQAVHSILVSSIAATINNATSRYFATLSGEGGGNAAAGMVYYGCTASFTTTQIDEG